MQRFFSKKAILFRKTRLDQLYKALNSCLFVCTVSHDLDGRTANDTERKNAEKALSVYSSLFLLDPDRRLEFISLLDEESSRTSVETYLILNHYFLDEHLILLLTKYISP